MDTSGLQQGFENVVTDIIEYLPAVIGALLILIIGYFIVKFIAGIVEKALQKVGFDRSLQKTPAGSVVSRVVERPSHFVGRVTFWLLFLGVISLAISALNLTALNDILQSIYAYVPRVIAAVIIFLVASAISAGTATFVQRVMGGSATAKLIGAVVPAITMSIAVFMILNELGIATDIVNILFTAIVGAVALGLALAFGLGGREVARGLLEQAVDSAKEKSATVKSDLHTASANTRREARDAKNKLRR